MSTKTRLVKRTTTVTEEYLEGDAPPAAVEEGGLGDAVPPMAAPARTEPERPKDPCPHRDPIKKEAEQQPPRSKPFFRPRADECEDEDDDCAPGENGAPPEGGATVQVSDTRGQDLGDGRLPSGVQLNGAGRLGCRPPGARRR